MALTHNTLCSRLCKFNHLRLLFNLVHRHTSKSSSRNVLNYDVLDIYTENLVQENCNKFNEFIFKVSLNKTNLINIFTNPCQILELPDHCTKEELVSKIIDSLRVHNVNNTVTCIKLCKERSYCLPYGFMLYLTKLFAKLGEKEGLELMQSYHKCLYANEFKKYCGFKHYTAQMLWYSGNFSESLDILEQLYQNCSVSLKYELNYIIYDIISDVIMKHGEALLVVMTNFIKQLADKYDNYYPMAILWRSLQESEWFADQELAKKILNDNEELIIVIKPSVPVWCVSYMQCHKIDVVHRLCEVLLKLNAIDQYSSVLHSLFDYYCKYTE